VGRPGLIGVAARTAVVAGTASAVVGHSQRKQSEKADTQAQAEAYQQQEAATAQQQEVDAAVAKALAAQQAQAAAVSPVAPAAPAATDVVGQLERLAALQTQGILTPDEFAAEKAKILAG
jgi:hypothetical protein